MQISFALTAYLDYFGIGLDLLNGSVCDYHYPALIHHRKNGLVNALPDIGMKKIMFIY